MEASLGFWSVPVLLLVVLSPARTEVIPAYFKEGGELVLPPPGVSERITNIEWQFASEKEGVYQVVQWVENIIPEVDDFLRFKDRAKLNLTTGELRLSGLNSNDVGKFSVELNNVLQSVKFDAKLMLELGVPEVHVKPLSCSAAHDSCTLSCSVETRGAEPITYFWSHDNGPWTEALKDHLIYNQKANAINQNANAINQNANAINQNANAINQNANANIKNYRCRVKNHVSQRDSLPIPDPFSRTTPGPSDPGTVVGAVLGVLVALLLAVTAFLLYYFREREPIRRWLSVLPCAKHDAASQPTNGEAAREGGRESESELETLKVEG